MQLTTRSRNNALFSPSIFLDEFFSFPLSQRESLRKFSVWRREGETVYMEMDVPGFSKNEVEVSLEGGVIRVTAKKEKEGLRASVDRTFSIPEALDEESLSASLENGVLRLSGKEKASLASRNRRLELK